MLNQFCTCNGCDTEHVFPAVDADQDCNSSIYESQVSGIIILPDGASFPADWTSASDWDGVVTNTDGSNNSGKFLAVVGGVEVPGKNIVTVSKGHQVVAQRRYRFEGAVFNMSSLNRDFLRALQCNPTNFRFWLYTLGENLFGGSSGMAPLFVDADLPLLAGEDDVETGTVIFEWRASCEPDRASVPGLDTTLTTDEPAAVVFGDGAGTVFSDGAGTVFTP